MIKRLFLMLSLMIFVTIGISSTASAYEQYMKPKAMSTSSWQKLSNIHKMYDVPYSMYKKNGTVDLNRSLLDEVYGSKIDSNIWGQNLPYTLTNGSESFPGYCANSGGSVSKNMVAQGYVTDSRLTRLISYISKGDPQNPNIYEAIGSQLMVWGALNYGFDPNLFKGGKMAASKSMYKDDVLKKAFDKMSNAMNSWQSTSTYKKMHPIMPETTTPKTFCHPKADEQVTVVHFTTIAGSRSLGDSLNNIAHVTFKGLPAGSTVQLGATPGITEKLKPYGIKQRDNVAYIFSPKQEKVTKGVDVTIKYKEEYFTFNHEVLIVYADKSGGSGYQPFLLPRKPILTWEIQTGKCPPKCIEDCCEDDCDKEVIPDAIEDEKILRWYNLPSAFGEFKNGKGFKNNAETTEGKYATTRNKEHFEAMNGVPTTESFYVNLGGTEGIMDVTYAYKEVKQDFMLQWKSKTVCPPPPAPPASAPPCNAGTKTFTDLFKWEFYTMDLQEASFRVFHDGVLRNEEIDVDVEIANTSSKPGKYKLNNDNPNLEAGPETDPTKLKVTIGATTLWQVETKKDYTGSPVTSLELPKKTQDMSKAYADGNKDIGKLFVQNDALTITILDKEYTYIRKQNTKEHEAFTKQGKGHSNTEDAIITDLVLDATLESTGLGKGEGLDYFIPRKEKWDVWSEVPIRGYNGNPEDDGARALKGSSPEAQVVATNESDSPLPLTHTPLLTENIFIKKDALNGIYNFQDTELENLLAYDEPGFFEGIVDGIVHDINSNVDELKDGENKGESVVYDNPKNPTNEDYFKVDNKLVLQYTNWQAPIQEGKNGITFKHAGEEPDNNMDSDLNGVPTYRSVNPILLHNPTTVQFSWVHDTNDAQLKDQRIDNFTDNIEPHASALDSTANSRQYIDFDFQITIPNATTFNSYWGQSSTTTDSVGQIDPDFTNPGQLGKIFNNTNTVDEYNNRLIRNPYMTEGGIDNTFMEKKHELDTKNTWDISKWVNAKYVKFPYDVYFYDGGKGGSPSGSYSAGSWIKLYDDGGVALSGDPEYFNFHVETHQRDVKDGIVYMVSESLNAPESLRGNPDALYAASELYTNGTRFEEGEPIGDYSAEKNGEATYASAYQQNVDAIGRIGNLLVSDTSDPSWKDVFWKLKANGDVDTTKPVVKDYSLNYNMYESGLLPNRTGFSAFNRYRTIHAWHGGSEPTYTLPVRTNPVSKGQSEQVIKLGYNLGGSIQTVGDYDYSMYIYPRNKLAGDFKTGNPNTPFKLVTSDPYAPGSKYMEYYDSSINNTVTTQGSIGKNYNPAYKHYISSSLADNRMKLSDWEKTNNTYKEAFKAGSEAKTVTGTPSWIQIPRALRTQIGSNETKGRYGWGQTHPTSSDTEQRYFATNGQPINGNNLSGSKGDGSGGSLKNGSCDCAGSYTNVQKWNWNYSLPNNTYIWFDGQTMKTGGPLLEKPNKDQYVITSMVFRTKTSRSKFPGEGDGWQTEIIEAPIGGTAYLTHNSQSIPDWDLTMYTNHGNQDLPPNTESASADPTIGSKYPPVTGVTMKPAGSDPSGARVTTKDKFDNGQGGNFTQPSIDIVWWNYAKQSHTDKDNIGTH